MVAGIPTCYWVLYSWYPKPPCKHKWLSCFQSGNSTALGTIELIQLAFSTGSHVPLPIKWYVAFTFGCHTAKCKDSVKSKVNLVFGLCLEISHCKQSEQTENQNTNIFRQSHRKLFGNVRHFG